MAHYITQTARHASLALAMILLAVLGLLALRADAQGADDAPVAVSPMREEAGAAKEARQALIDEQRTERQTYLAEQRSAMEQLRAGGASPEEMQAAMEASREEARTMFDTQREARVEARIEARARIAVALDERREAIQARIETRRLEMDERRESFKARLQEQAQERVRSVSNGVGAGMTNALANLEQVVARILTRIEAYEADGVDMSAARAVFDGVDEIIADAHTDVSAFLSLAELAIESEDPKADMEAVREAASAAKESIKLVHQTMSDTVQEIKNAVALRAEVEAETEAEGAETDTSAS